LTIRDEAGLGSTAGHALSLLSPVEPLSGLSSVLAVVEDPTSGVGPLTAGFSGAGPVPFGICCDCEDLICDRDRLEGPGAERGCAVKDCRAADLAGQQLPLQQRKTHTVWRKVDEQARALSCSEYRQLSKYRTVELCLALPVQHLRPGPQIALRVGDSSSTSLGR
jgi:hypothetical protein